MNCETDFAAKTEDLKSFASELASLALSKDSCTTDIDVKSLQEDVFPDSEPVENKFAELHLKMGENLCLRRGRVIDGGNCLLSGYAHGGQGLTEGGSCNGRAAAVVAIDSGEESATQMRKEELRELGRQIAQHIVGFRPLHTDRPEGINDEQAKEQVLLEQPFLFDSDKTVGEVLADKIGKAARISDFVRFECGEKP